MSELAREFACSLLDDGVIMMAMRGLYSLVLVLAVGCGGNHGQSVCDNQVPPPPVCMTACDPMPGVPNTCPGGYHCTPDGTCDAVCTPTGGQCGDGYLCTGDGQCIPDVTAQCAKKGLPPTSLSGTVFAPNGTLPLFGVNVYVPSVDPAPFPAGAQCSKCSDELPGGYVAQTTTNEAGQFSLTAVPPGAVSLVIASGKWRRVVKIPSTMECADNPVAAPDTTLPKSMDDMTANTKSVEIPKIALSTGSADSLECLLRKLGIADKEIGTAGGAQRIHLYDDKSSGGKGVGDFKGGFPGGMGAFADSQTLWDSVDHLKAYDITILSCEGGQFPETKSQTDMNALKAYADLGGRVFLSHWHNIWIEGATEGGGNQKPAIWTGIATWSNGGNLGNGTIDLIDETHNGKGAAFAQWMLNVMGSPTRDQVPIQDGTGRSTCQQVDTTKGERWTYVQGQGDTTQNFQFTTPAEAPADTRCGKVVFSDMHVSGGPGNGSYPDSCQGGLALSPQEKALAFMFFDLASCVGSIF